MELINTYLLYVSFLFITLQADLACFRHLLDFNISSYPHKDVLTTVRCAKCKDDLIL